MFRFTMETNAGKKSKYELLSAADLIKELTDRDSLIVMLRNEVYLLKDYLFSSKKERFKPDPEGMVPLFDEAENTADQSKESHEVQEESADISAYKRKKRGKRQILPQWIQRIRKEYDLTDEEKICRIHNSALEKIGEDISEKLEIIPASVRVLQHVTFKYKCPCCEEGGFKQAVREPDPIPKSFASAGLLAQIAVAKYEDALPLYRQEKILGRYGIDLDRLQVVVEET